MTMAATARWRRWLRCGVRADGALLWRKPAALPFDAATTLLSSWGTVHAAFQRARPRVTASLSTGEAYDVTAWSGFASSNDGLVAISGSGSSATFARPGGSSGIGTVLMNATFGGVFTASASLQADGGTRCASITGGYVALVMALRQMERAGVLKDYTSVLKHQIAAVSCGVYQGQAVLDLDYAEDSNAIADANFVMTGSGSLVEVQATAEERPFSQQDFSALMTLAEAGIRDLVVLQKQSLG